jgi:hypothetical protein
MKEFKPIIIGLCFAAVFIGGFQMGKLETQPPETAGERETTPRYSYFETLDDVKKVESEQNILNIRQRNNNINLNNYSDEEIRILREKQSFKSDGGYIYTPGRHVTK